MSLCQKGIHICSLPDLEDYGKTNLTLRFELYGFKLSKIFCGENRFVCLLQGGVFPTPPWLHLTKSRKQDRILFSRVEVHF